MVIWGWRSDARQPGGGGRHCWKCEYTGVRSVVLLKRKSTLFSIPPFTIRKRYLGCCYHCGYTTILDKRDELLEDLVG